MDSLTTAFEKCYTPSPISIVLADMPDVCRWMHKFMVDMSYHSQPHVFKFTKDSKGKAVMVTKRWSTDASWTSCTGTNKDYILSGLPSGCPSLIKPDYDGHDLDKLRDSVNNATKFMSADSKAWWDNWFKETEDVVNRNSFSHYL
jgi:hypothetical protein